MNFKIYTVYDAKIAAYMHPFVARQDGEAQRMFQQAALSEGHQFNQNGSDFTLFRIAEWDDQTARYEQLDAPYPLGTALEFATQPRQTIAEAIREIPVEEEDEN